MNDRHGGRKGWFQERHPEWQIREPTLQVQDWNSAMDFSFLEVREWMLGMMREVAQQYDVDGLELDYMRWCHMFRRRSHHKGTPCSPISCSRSESCLTRWSLQRARFAGGRPECLSGCGTLMPWATTSPPGWREAGLSLSLRLHVYRLQCRLRGARPVVTDFGMPKSTLRFTR